MKKDLEIQGRFIDRLLTEKRLGYRSFYYTLVYLFLYQRFTGIHVTTMPLAVAIQTLTQ